MCGVSRLAGLVVLLMSAVAALLFVAGVGVASADPPFRLADRITDRAGVLDPAATARVTEAINQLRTDKGYDLFVVYVHSFDGAQTDEWAARTATLSQLGRTDVLLAIAVDDRAYHISYDQDFPLGQQATDDIASKDVEPRLVANDWAGAAVGLADGLRTGGGSGSGSGLVVAGVIGVAVVGGGAYLVTRRRRNRAKADAPASTTPVGPAPQPSAPDEFAGVSTDDLAYRGSQALLDIDEAVRTSEQELAAARAHFGDAAVAEFAAALETSRTEMLRGFTLQQQLDDDIPEDEPTKRSMLAEIIAVCRSADERLDAQVAAFDKLRNLEATAPDYIAGLATRLDAANARLPEAEAGWAELRSRYAQGSWEPAAGNLDQAREFLSVAATEIEAARAALAGRPAPPVGPGSGSGSFTTAAAPGSGGSAAPSDGTATAAPSGAAPSGAPTVGPSVAGSVAGGHAAGSGGGAPVGGVSAGGAPAGGAVAAAATGPSAAVVTGRAAEDAITQADTLLDGLTRLAADLAAAGERIAAARAETEQDIAEAHAILAGGDPGGLSALVARAEAALASATEAQNASPPDPMAALRLIDEADGALDRGLVTARDAQTAAKRAAAALDQALLTARPSVAAAADFIGSRRGAVGAEARTRLSEAQRHLAQAQAQGIAPDIALAEAQAADTMGRQALDLARSDVSRWSGGGGAGGGLGGGLGAELGSLVLGGILSGGLSGGRSGGFGGGYGGGYGGGGGGFGGGGGGRSPGSFGGSGTRGRRGGGGRF